MNPKAIAPVCESHRRAIGRPDALRTGLTLVEALIGLFLLAAGVAWALQTNVYGLRLSQETEEALVVVKGVQEYALEVLRDTPFATLTSFTPDTWISFGSLPPGANPPSLSALRNGVVEFRVDGLGVAPPASSWNRLRVTVRVTWTDFQGRPNQTSFGSTEITRGGLTGS